MSEEDEEDLDYDYVWNSYDDFQPTVEDVKNIVVNIEMGDHPKLVYAAILEANSKIALQFYSRERLLTFLKLLVRVSPQYQFDFHRKSEQKLKS
jgi:hypothetical protein